ncbi:SMP-30/gluconolactonase/LRE family protein [Pedobacter arcticus]|uniref:hypothetical protein n=1 Tax=Pedobacter arcticus TaxID=752140 RepID=UPI0002D65E20|nr:hypothetical protein [Pedobacter arcticus]
MKKISSIFIALLINSITTKAQQKHQLTKLWQTDTVVAVPESVLPDFKKNILYVSQIGLGNNMAFDNNGKIAKLGTDGKIIDLHWASGLDSPKGLGRFGNNLYVADLNKVVIINIATGKVKKKILVENAVMLNDITVNDKGVVYISDSKTKKIHTLKNDEQLSTFMEGVGGVNGLKAIGDDLYILGGKRFFKVDAEMKETDIAQISQGGDGLEPIGNGDFLATSWGGYIFYVHENGAVETLLDSHSPRVNTADLAYDAKKRILYVPSFNNKMVTAYQLK